MDPDTEVVQWITVKTVSTGLGSCHQNSYDYTTFQLEGLLVTPTTLIVD